MRVPLCLFRPRCERRKKIWRNTRHTNTITVVACGFWQRAIYSYVVESGRWKPSLSSSARFQKAKTFPSTEKILGDQRRKWRKFPSEKIFFSIFGAFCRTSSLSSSLLCSSSYPISLSSIFCKFTRCYAHNERTQKFVWTGNFLAEIIVVLCLITE